MLCTRPRQQRALALRLPEVEVNLEALIAGDHKLLIVDQAASETLTQTLATLPVLANPQAQGMPSQFCGHSCDRMRLTR